jgi:pimeloyl-ACP methyl ester carboxylesterase
MGEQLDLIKAYSLDRIGSESVAALRSLMEQFGAPAIPLDILARIAVPTTLIWGRHDRRRRCQSRNKPASALVALRVIDDAADDPALEQPEAFTMTLRAALGESKTRGQGYDCDGSHAECGGCSASPSMDPSTARDRSGPGSRRL